MQLASFTTMASILHSKDQKPTFDLFLKRSQSLYKSVVFRNPKTYLFFMYSVMGVTLSSFFW